MSRCTERGVGFDALAGVSRAPDTATSIPGPARNPPLPFVYFNNSLPAGKVTENVACVENQPRAHRQDKAAERCDLDDTRKLDELSLPPSP